MSPLTLVSLVISIQGTDYFMALPNFTESLLSELYMEYCEEDSEDDSEEDTSCEDEEESKMQK